MTTQQHKFKLNSEDSLLLERVAADYGFSVLSRRTHASDAIPDGPDSDLLLIPDPAMFMEPDKWAVVYSPSQGTLATPGTDIIHARNKGTGYSRLTWLDVADVANHEEAILLLDVLLSTLRLAAREPAVI